MNQNLSLNHQVNFIYSHLPGIISLVYFIFPSGHISWPPIYPTLNIWLPKISSSKAFLCNARGTNQFQISICISNGQIPCYTPVENYLIGRLCYGPYSARETIDYFSLCHFVSKIIYTIINSHDLNKNVSNPVVSAGTIMIKLACRLCKRLVLEYFMLSCYCIYAHLCGS